MAKMLCIVRPKYTRLLSEQPSSHYALLRFSFTTMPVLRHQDGGVLYWHTFAMMGRVFQPLNDCLAVLSHGYCSVPSPVEAHYCVAQLLIHSQYA